MAIVPKAAVLTPSSVKVQLPTNYISLFDFSNQYLPDTHERLFAKFGNQSILGMLSRMGAEMPSQSDQFIWTEEGRLFTTYTDVTRVGATFTKAGHVFRVGETIQISDTDQTIKGYISAVDAGGTDFTVLPYKAAGFTGLATTGLRVWVDGSEFKKGTEGMDGTLETDFTVYRNNPIILKDNFEVSGSDATNIGWIQTAQGYFWYLKSEADTRLRWENRLELAMILGEKAEAGSDAANAGLKGTEGMFEAIRSRGHKYIGVVDSIADVDALVDVFDKEGKIQDYLMYCDRAQSLAIDDMLGELNAGYSGGVSYGIFKNGEKQAIDLGFRGFKRGSYNFMKTDYKLLNDPTLLGGVPNAAGKVRFVLAPVGTKEVYEGEGMGGSRENVPFLHIKYKEANGESRRFKSWVTGSVGPVKTNTKDSMVLSLLSERGMCLAGANNFVIGEGTE